MRIVDGEAIYSVPPRDDVVVLVFLEKCSPYNGGETAGFSPEIARKYVDAKVAVYQEAVDSILKPKPEGPREAAIFEDMEPEQIEAAKRMISKGVQVTQAVEMARSGVVMKPPKDSEELAPQGERHKEIEAAADDIEQTTGERPLTGAAKIAQDAAKAAQTEALEHAETNEG